MSGDKKKQRFSKNNSKNLSKDETLSLADGLDHLKDLMIYEAQASGTIHDYLCKLPKYIRSKYFDDIPLGSMNNSGIRCEDLESLTFPDNSFDLVITQDVFEHIMNPERALKEIYRVLKPGGCHISTIPFHEGRKIVRRVKREEGKNVFILPPVYHTDPLRESGSLVYTDFGEDIVDHLNSLGISTEIVLHERFYPPEMIPWINDEASYETYVDSCCLIGKCYRRGWLARERLVKGLRILLSLFSMAFLSTKGLRCSSCLERLLYNVKRLLLYILFLTVDS